MKYDSKKASERLRDLRKSRNLSQSEMGGMLAAVITERVLDSENGKNTVSQLERNARGITLEYAFAYADLFDVSLDYVLGHTDDWTPDNKNAKEATGLTDASIRKIREIGNNAYGYGRHLHILNSIIENNEFSSLINKLNRYSIFSSTELQEGVYSKKSESLLFETREVTVSYETFAAVSLYEACDILKSIAKSIPLEGGDTSAT